MIVNQQSTYDSEDGWEEMMAHLVTEDDTPVDNRFSERQQRLLPSILFSSWEEGKPFEAVSNVGLFYSLHGEPPVVPDFMLSLGVEPRPVTKAKADRSYMTWIYGKAPDLVVEVVSNREGGELTSKLDIYAKVRVTYYVVYDPFAMLGDRELRTFRLTEGRYFEMVPGTLLPEVGLGLTIWEGVLEDTTARWLRFTDREGRMLPTAEEARAQAEEARAQAEESRAKAEESRAQAEESRAQAEESRAQAEEGRAQAEESRAQAERRAATAEARATELEKRLRELGLDI